MIIEIKNYNSTFYIKTWGCQMNVYDSYKIQQIMIYKKYIQVFNYKLANILILNTCSIRKKAEDKVFNELGRWYKYSIKNNKNIIIAIGGCVAVQHANILLKKIPFINIIFSPKTLHKIPYLINLFKKTKLPVIYLNNKENNFLSKFIHLPNKKILCNYITIMEGCNKYCSYCIVPYTRGNEISRPVNDILLEIEILILNGLKEIVLLGQNVNAYKGKLIINNNLKIIKFSQLLKLIINKFSNLLRIRFISSHPIDFTDDIIDTYKNNKIANLLHLPIQSGSNIILKKMNRKYTVEKYLSIINKLKKIRPNINISSDFIVGYPEETKQDLIETIKIIKIIKFDKSYSFIYSPRQNTPASKIINNISEKEKKQRLFLVQKILNKIYIEINNKMINSYQSVLINNHSLIDNNILIGITDNNRKVLFKGNKNLIGSKKKIKIISYKNKYFIGKLI